MQFPSWLLIKIFSGRALLDDAAVRKGRVGY